MTILSNKFAFTIPLFISRKNNHMRPGVFYIIVKLYEIFYSIIQRIAIDMMNHLSMYYQIIWMVLIPNIMRTMDIAFFVYGWIIREFFMNKKEIIFFTVFIFLYPSTLIMPVFLSFAGSTYLIFYFFCHSIACFVGAYARTIFRHIINSVNTLKFFITYRTNCYSFHNEYYNMKWSILWLG